LNENNIENMGFRDSKILSEKQREQGLEKIEKLKSE
jgi:ribonuclease HII